MKTNGLQPKEIASYFLSKSLSDGDLITNLKMQKLVYYAYSWVLTLNNAKLFNEPIEAWPNGPVVPTLYRDLSGFGSGPIDSTFIDDGAETKVSEMDAKVKYTLDSVYESYIPLSAFELVSMTHNELPWKKARTGLGATEHSNVHLDDKDIVEYFSNL